MARIRIGFGGKPRHGKTTAAEAIRRAYGAESVEIISISELICAELGVKREEVADVRDLQRHSHARCAADGLYWARQAQIRSNQCEKEIVVLANVRRVDEAEYFLGHGWALARVMALNADGSLYVPMDAARDLNDPLETALDRWNWPYRMVAQKPGQKEWLEAQAEALVDYLLDVQEAEAQYADLV